MKKTDLFRKITDTLLRFAAAFYIFQCSSGFFSPEDEMKAVKVYGLIGDDLISVFIFLSGGFFISLSVFIFLSICRRAAFVTALAVLSLEIILKMISVFSGAYNACGCSDSGGDTAYVFVISGLNFVTAVVLIYLLRSGRDVEFKSKT